MFAGRNDTACFPAAPFFPDGDAASPVDSLYTNWYTGGVSRLPTIEVDRDAAEPVYEQIARQVRAQVAAGRLRPGAELPSVRTLASDLGVNLNTVARAYRQLEEDGFLVIHERSGAVIAAPPADPDPTLAQRLRRELRLVLEHMRQAGFSPADLRRATKREIDALDGRR